VEGSTERGLGGSRAWAGEGEEDGKEDKEGTESWCKFCTGHFFAPLSLKAKLATWKMSGLSSALGVNMYRINLCTSCENLEDSGKEK